MEDLLRPLGRPRVVRHHQHGLAVVAHEQVDEVQDLVRALAVQVAGGLVAPATVMLPALGTAGPPSRFRSVVLPEPLGPMKARKSPLSTSRFSPCRTWISSLPRTYFLSRLRTLMRLFPLPLPSFILIVLGPG